MRARALTSAVLGLTLVLGGCIWPFGGKNKHDPDAAAWAQEPVTVHVTNHNWADVVIYAARSGSNRYRLGDVVTGRTETFTVPQDLYTGGNVAFLIDPIGSRESFSTGLILVAPGQQVELVVENQLSTTSWSVASVTGRRLPVLAFR